MTVVHSDTHTRERFLKLSVGLGLVFVHLFRFSILCDRSSFFSTMPKDWLGRTSPKFRILCQVGRKTLSQL